MRRFLRVPITLLVLLFLAGRVVFAEAGARDLVILHVNDAHGRLFAPEKERDSGGVVDPTKGGAARVGTLVRDIRAQNPDKVLFLFAGDDLSSTDPVTIYYGGAATVQVMNELGLDAWTPGNGEFYGGLDRLLALRTQAKFVMLHANVAYKESGGEIFQPWKIKEVNGTRVGILGLGVVRMEHPASQCLELREPMEVAKDLVPVLRAKSDLVVLLTHTGDTYDRKLAAEVPGIDIIVGGHTHTRMDTPERVKRADGGEVVIAQAGDQYQFLGRLDVSIRPDGAKVIQGRLIPVDASVAGDPAVSSMLQGYLTPLEKPICVAKAAIPNPKAGESPLGALVARAIQAAVPDAMVILDRGAVQGEITPGPVTLAKVSQIHPYHNRVIIVQMTPEQIEDVIAKEHAFSAGCRLGTVDGKTALLRIGKARPDAGRRYPVAVTSYLQGTNTELRNLAATPTNLYVDTILADYFKKVKRVGRDG